MRSMVKNDNGSVAGERSILARNTGALAVMQVAKYIFPIITLPYLARVLGPDVYAVRAYVISYMVFMSTILDYGFSQYGTKYVAEHSEDSRAISRVNAGVYCAKSCMFIVAAVITMAITPFVSIMSNNVLFVVVSLVSVAVKSFLPDFVLQGLRDMRAIAIRFTVTQALAVLLIFICVHDKEQLLLVPIMEGSAALVSVIWAQAYLKRIHGVGVSRFNASDMIQIITKSTPFFFAVAASSFMANTITVLMGVFTINPLLLSCWSIATTIIQGIQALWQPISRSLFPHMVVCKDASLIRKLLRFGVPATVVIALACYCGADQIMLLMGGPDYIEGSYVLKWVAPVILFSYPISILGYPVIGAIGKPSHLSFCIAVTGGLQFAILLVAGLTGHFTIQIIAMARCGTEAFLFLLEASIAIRTLRDVQQDERR